MARDAVAEVILIAGCVLGAGACGRPAVEVRPPNIFLISIDALRADHLGCYGYDRPTSPVLDELASRGTRFSSAFVNTHGTPPSHTTLLSSLYQETHQVDLDGSHDHGNDHRIPDEVELVQEILQREGWRTIAVTGGGYMSAEFGFARGFDEFVDRVRGVNQGVEKLLEALAGQTGEPRPIFALFHTYEELLHVPLIVFGTGVEHGVVNPRLVSLVDVAPTILSVAGLPVPARMEGRDFLGDPSPVTWPAQRVFAQYGSQLYCVRTPRWKLIWRPSSDRAQLFDLRHDPTERRNLVRKKPEESARLLAEIETWRRTRRRLDLVRRPAEDLSAEKAEELRALGYAE